MRPASNLGASCFVNTAFAALFACWKVRRAVRASAALGQESAVTKRLADVLCAAQSGLPAARTSPYQPLHHLCDEVRHRDAPNEWSMPSGTNHLRVYAGEHDDSVDFLRRLLGALAQEDSEVAHLFTGAYADVYACPHSACPGSSQWTTRRTDPFMYIT